MLQTPKSHGTANGGIGLIRYLIALPFLFFIYSANAQWQDKVILTTHNLCPYGCYKEEASTAEDKNTNDYTDRKNNFSGIAVEVVNCAFEKIQQPFEIVVVPWSRAQKLVIDNKADGFFAASQKNSRDKFAVMSTIIAEQKWQWYLLADNPLQPNQVDFKDKAIVAGFRGANKLAWLVDNDYNVASTTLDAKSLLNVLRKERVDAILGNNLVMDKLIAQYDIASEIKSYVEKDKPLGVYFAKTFINKHPDFLDKFNESVLSCRGIN